MSSATIDRLIINSPYTEPSRHWRYERETRAFSLAEGRRPAGNVVLYVKKQPAFFESKFVIEKRADLLSDVESRTLSSIIMMVLLIRRG